MKPVQKGLYPLRCSALKARNQIDTIKAAMVNHNMNVSFMKNPNPTELASPAYAGQQDGQSSLGTNAIPIPGSVFENKITGFMDLLLLVQGLQGWGTRERDQYRCTEESVESGPLSSWLNRIFFFQYS